MNFRFPSVQRLRKYHVVQFLTPASEHAHNNNDNMLMSICFIENLKKNIRTTIQNSHTNRSHFLISCAARKVQEFDHKPKYWIDPFEKEIINERLEDHPRYYNSFWGSGGALTFVPDFSAKHLLGVEIF